MTTWDEAKRKRNIAKHGVDLAAADAFEFEAALVYEDVNRAYGEHALSQSVRSVCVSMSMSTR